MTADDMVLHFGLVRRLFSLIASAALVGLFGMFLVIGYSALRWPMMLVCSLLVLLGAFGCILAVREIIRPKDILLLTESELVDQRSKIRIPWTEIAAVRASKWIDFWWGLLPLPQRAVFLSLRNPERVVGQRSLTQWFGLSRQNPLNRSGSLAGESIVVDVLGLDMSNDELVDIFKRRMTAGPIARG